MAEVELVDLGVIEYSEALELQKEYFNKVIESIAAQQYLLLCEHPHVYTLGKSGKEDNLLVSDDFLKSIGATYHKTDRGGDITYHGYGQLVGYPIVNINTMGVGIRDYIFRVEQAVIETLKHWDIEAERIDSATGVWVKDPKKGDRKICAIGVKVSRYVTMHGFALNVNTDLNYFKYINPCGFTQKGVVSIKQLVNERADRMGGISGQERQIDSVGDKQWDIDTVKQVYAKEFAIQFGCEIK